MAKQIDVKEWLKTLPHEIPSPFPHCAKIVIDYEWDVAFKRWCIVTSVYSTPTKRVGVSATYITQRMSEDNDYLTRLTETWLKKTLAFSEKYMNQRS